MEINMDIKMDTNIRNEEDGLMITDNHVFFYNSRCPLSNFYYPTRFRFSFNAECHTFFSSEQAFMWSKAKLFGDEETAKKILFEGNMNPLFCRDQGRLVKNCDVSIWNAVRFSQLLNINYEKFDTSEELRNFILDERFEGRTFAGVSRPDTTWGIGMDIDDAGIDDELNWKGENLSGKSLTMVRTMLKRKYGVHCKGDHENECRKMTAGDIRKSLCGIHDDTPVYICTVVTDKDGKPHGYNSFNYKIVIPDHIEDGDAYGVIYCNLSNVHK